MKYSKIEWCDHTFNPWIGCTKVSPGCAHCYAFALDHRWGHDSWGPGKPRRRTSEANWRQPIKWNRDATKWSCEKCGTTVVDPEQIGSPFTCPSCQYVLSPERRPRVFCASLADWLDDEVPIEWLADLLNLIRLTPNLDWLLLTKRPENWLERISRVFAFTTFSPRHHEMGEWLIQWHPKYESAGGVPGKPIAPENVWIGTTVEDQQRADERIPLLLKIPAKVRFLSCEPLLGPVNLTTIIKDGIGRDALRVNDSSMGDPERHIDWVIAGGESGPGARPMHPEWARSLRDQCQAAGVPFLFKQWGEWLARSQYLHVEFTGSHLRLTQVENRSAVMRRDGRIDEGLGKAASTNDSDSAIYPIGKCHTGRLLDGVEHNGFPKVEQGLHVFTDQYMSEPWDKQASKDGEL